MTEIKEIHPHLIVSPEDRIGHNLSQLAKCTDCGSVLHTDTLASAKMGKYKRDFYLSCVPRVGVCSPIMAKAVLAA